MTTHVAAILVAMAMATGLLVGFSVLHFTRSGPALPQAALRPYRPLMRRAVLKLGFASALLCLVMATGGALAHRLLVPPSSTSFAGALLGALLGIAGVTGGRFLWLLRVNPGLILAAFPWRPSRLYPVWRCLARARPTPEPVAAPRLDDQAPQRTRWRAPAARYRRAPNVLLIGCDTLRADHLFGGQVPIPALSRLLATSTSYVRCETPCARTAPALLSLMSGLWPTTHAVRDNFLTHDQPPPMPVSLPRLLREAGYRSVVVSDWCGADFGKFDFGFDTALVPPDHWNLPWLLRQGPKGLRLFLSLFAGGDWGRRWLPEIHYQGGVPTTTNLVRLAARQLRRLAREGQPFCLNVFLSTAHAPFAVEYPWYATPGICTHPGESRFALSRLTDPLDVLRRQAEPREAFELDQVLRLYGACVQRFDAAVGELRRTLAETGQAQQTIIVVYADHGTDFFEHGSWGQGNNVRSPHSSRVPLVVHDPRNPHGVIDDRTASTVDFLPTLLEHLGLPCPAGLDGCSLLGTNHTSGFSYTETGIWLTQLPGQAPTHLAYPDLMELLTVGGDGTLLVKPEYRARVIAAKDRAVTRGDWKLVYEPHDNGPRLALFDSRRDPDCRHDLAAQLPARVAALVPALQPFLAADGLALPLPAWLPRASCS